MVEIRGGLDRCVKGDEVGDMLANGMELKCCFICCYSLYQPSTKIIRAFKVTTSYFFDENLGHFPNAAGVVQRVVINGQLGPKIATSGSDFGI
jgi:hypothetical protein